MSEQGLESRLKFLEEQCPPGQTIERQPYYDRLQTELDVIIQMGFPGYFLIVMDFIDWAKKHSIPVGPGRGSGAGSLVAYALYITDLDPLERMEIFAGNFFLELQRTGRPFEQDYIQQAIDFSSQFQVPLVATNDVRFIDASDFESHEVRVCICSGFTLQDERRPRNYSPQQYLRSNEEMLELFSDIPEALENTVNIAKACNVRLKLGENYLPEYKLALHAIYRCIRF